MKKGPFASCTTSRTPWSMPERDVQSLRRSRMGCCRTDWRRLSAIRGATLVTSSPRMKHRIGRLHFAAARECAPGPDRRISSIRRSTSRFASGNACIKPVRPDQRAQREVAFKRCARRADSNHVSVNAGQVAQVALRGIGAIISVMKLGLPDSPARCSQIRSRTGRDRRGNIR